jgi:hypothetical protein
MELAKKKEDELGSGEGRVEVFNCELICKEGGYLQPGRLLIKLMRKRFAGLGHNPV